MKTQLDYAFSPSLLDDYQRMIDTRAEDYFYQDENGAWHLNWNEAEETLHYSEEEVYALLKQEFIDRVNKVPIPPSEAASKGSAFNEIVDCLVKRCKPSPGFIIKTIRKGSDLYEARCMKAVWESTARNMKDVWEDPSMCDEQFKRIGTTFVYAACNGFEFFFDMNLCLEAAGYFKDSICQYYTKCLLDTPKGLVELHGYIDYLRRDKIYDAKTTKRYTFGDYQKRWQRYTYPFSMIESGMMNDVNSFEFTIYLLKGGTSRTPLISATQYKEVYTYDHEQARQILTQQCERVIEFLECNRELITNMKVFGKEDNNGISDNG